MANKIGVRSFPKFTGGVGHGVRTLAISIHMRISCFRRVLESPTIFVSIILATFLIWIKKNHACLVVHITLGR